jgi:magnesium transporter
MNRSVLFRPNEIGFVPLDIDQISIEKANPNNLIWVSLEEPSIEELDSILTGIFHFHPLAVEDCHSTSYQSPKVDDFNNYLFLILHAARPSLEDGGLVTSELDIFLGENYLVTVSRNGSIPPVNEVWNRLEKDERLRMFGADFLCHAVIDHLVDGYMPIIDQMDEDIEWLEDKVLEKPNPETLQTILNLKHSIASLRRIIGPQREVMNRLSRDEFAVVDQQSKIYFRDVYDHLVRIQDLSDNIRDIASGALDIYLNSTSLRLNEIMKALTIVSTIFLPLSFVAGVYGMNFTHMPEISWQYGYFMVWGVFILVFVLMIAFFKHRGWF